MKLFADHKMVAYTDQIVQNWEEGVKVASQMLINNGYVNEEYINKIITITNELGQYYVIAPKIALLHTAPNEKMRQNAISFTYFKNPIIFKPEDRYHVNFCLALVAKDNFSHINILQAVAQLFSQQEFLHELQTCNSNNELMKVLQKYDN
ncbi:PTS system, ascorbate-specific IIA component [Spiroplasma sp. NBRC 100390]|uniref:PTS sugar transporter subunit IIA n=1 Tax=unclassified Spiroplasma TaxID=2637901 RepID=UPI0008929CA7|nr:MULTISPECIES: PTS sugar transporter subunit IIA [unclassified Spiroplasma]AOX43832.1 PTS system, ascorbate-specific IIA component [Spiroplasma sp. TU-14]APE13302.1 PTS system, ascorbate-specific IIA component [Spiroplasma sp. NBRC 100390]